MINQVTMHQVYVQGNWNVVIMLSSYQNVPAPAWTSSPLIHITINVDAYFVLSSSSQSFSSKTEKIKELTTLTLVINIKIAQHLAVLFTVHYTIFKLFLPLQPSTDPVTRRKKLKNQKKRLLNFLFPIRTVFQLINIIRIDVKIMKLFQLRSKYGNQFYAPDFKKISTATCSELSFSVVL